MIVKTNGNITVVISEKHKYLTVKEIEDIFTEKVGYVRRIDCEDIKDVNNIIEKDMIE